jgi:molybdopterin synthase catalytic subunit
MRQFCLCYFNLGTTRDNFDGKRVLRLEYEAYKEMAEKEMKNICAELRCKWPQLEHIAIVHRLGSEFIASIFSFK